MQGKQDVFLQRANLLNQECEQLQSRLVELVDEEQSLRDQNVTLQRKSELAEGTIATLKVSICVTYFDKLFFPLYVLLTSLYFFSSFSIRASGVL